MERTISVHRDSLDAGIMCGIKRGLMCRDVEKKDEKLFKLLNCNCRTVQQQAAALQTLQMTVNLLQAKAQPGIL